MAESVACVLNDYLITFIHGPNSNFAMLKRSTHHSSYGYCQFVTKLRINGWPGVQYENHDQKNLYLGFLLAIITFHSLDCT